LLEYDFILKFDLPDPTIDPADCVAALGAEGCTDALVGIGQVGLIALDFAREGASAREAVTSAIADVQRAIPGARLVEATPDLVGLTEIADILGFSRQYMRKLAYSCVRTFPAPAHEGNPTMWHLARVLRWFQTQNRYEVDEVLVDLAQLNMHLNIAVTELDADPKEIEEMRSLLA
jgi:hypothetical protein